jgi:hypothetical protein
MIVLYRAIIKPVLTPGRGARRAFAASAFG